MINITMERVNDKTRAGKEGKVITCPICHCSKPVYHFSWSSLQCTFCKANVEKTDWLIVEDYEPPLTKYL